LLVLNLCLPFSVLFFFVDVRFLIDRVFLHVAREKFSLGFFHPPPINVDVFPLNSKFRAYALILGLRAPFKLFHLAGWLSDPFFPFLSDFSYPVTLLLVKLLFLRYAAIP